MALSDKTMNALLTLSREQRSSARTRITEKRRLLSSLKMKKYEAEMRKQEKPYEQETAYLQREKLRREVNPTPEDTATKEADIKRLATAREEAKTGYVPGAEAGRVTLARESLQNIDDVIGMLYPDGTPKSFRRDYATASRIPLLGAVPGSEIGQKIYSRMESSLAGRQLIQTGVAANPKEVRSIHNAFVVNATSNPSAGLDQLKRLKNFYSMYLDTVTSRKIPKSSEGSDYENYLKIVGGK